MAWLNTAPQVEHSGPGPTPRPVSRLKSRLADDIPIVLPPNPDPKITEWLLDVGPSLCGAMGDRPIEWSDIAAWRSEAGIEGIEPWDKRLLIHLSRVWCSQRADAERPDCSEPMLDEAEAAEATSERVDRQIEAIFGTMARAQAAKGGTDGEKRPRRPPQHRARRRDRAPPD
jgi:hypothetical protein